MTGLLRDPDLGEVVQNPLFKKKMRRFFISKPFKRAWDL